jgi:hypothetical protein
MGRGDRFPPLTFFHDGETYWLAHGFHRYHAAVGVLGMEGSFACEVHLDDVRRTNEDKRRAVMKLLNDAEWSHWSDREIARLCAVDKTLVSPSRANCSLWCKTPDAA